ncbi:MAG: ATP-binding cassette domain-containing protein [Coprococcus sp.]
MKKGMFNKVVGQKNVVDHVSLELEKGKTLAIVGESGCGKTVLTRVMLGIEDKTDGSIVFEGKSVDDMTPQEKSDMKAKIQMIFQDTLGSLHPRMSIRESLEEPLILNGVKDKEEREKIILDTLSQVGMAPMFLDRYPHQLSGGQRQRIIIARCLVVTPKIIFADEPISALDVSLQAQVINMLMDLQDKYKLSMLLIAHDLAVVRQIADQIKIMYFGEIVECTEQRDIQECAAPIYKGSAQGGSEYKQGT